MYLNLNDKVIGNVDQTELKNRTLDVIGHQNTTHKEIKTNTNMNTNYILLCCIKANNKRLKNGQKGKEINNKTLE